MSGNVTPVEGTLRPIDPTCKILCSCQGAIEICLRFICIVLCVVVLSVASLSRARINEVNDVPPFDDDRDKYEAASGWMIFVSVIAIVTEASIVLIRFLNLSAVNKMFALIGVLDVVTSFVLMACMFAGWVPNAVYSGDIKDLRQDCEALVVPTGDLCHQLKHVESAQAATAVFGALTMLAFLVLAVYMIIFTICGWNNTVITNQFVLYGDTSYEDTSQERENEHLLKK